MPPDPLGPLRGVMGQINLFNLIILTPLISAKSSARQN
jgi:hypothetical protein